MSIRKLESSFHEQLELAKGLLPSSEHDTVLFLGSSPSPTLESVPENNTLAAPLPRQHSLSRSISSGSGFSSASSMAIDVAPFLDRYSKLLVDKIEATVKQSLSQQ